MWSLARYFRKRYSAKYPERFIQGIDYKEIDHPEYKYEMTLNRVIWTNVKGYRIYSPFFSLAKDGRMTMFIKYRWDGPSGPTVDTPSFMRSSGVHDVFFQCFREGLFGSLTEKEFQALFRLTNEELERLSILDGMIWPRSYIVKVSVQKFGERYAVKE
jgi:hypothetical protein